jgi:hypothetical protein
VAGDALLAKLCDASEGVFLLMLLGPYTDLLANHPSGGGFRAFGLALHRELRLYYVGSGEISRMRNLESWRFAQRWAVVRLVRRPFGLGLTATTHTPIRCFRPPDLP